MLLVVEKESSEQVTSSMLHTSELVFKIQSIWPRQYELVFVLCVFPMIRLHLLSVHVCPVQH